MDFTEIIMKIKDTAVKLYSSHSAFEASYAEESLRFWIGSESANPENRPADKFSLSMKAADLMDFVKADGIETRLNPEENAGTNSLDPLGETGLDNKQKVAIRLIEMMFEQMTGKNLSLADTFIKIKEGFEEMNKDNAVEMKLAATLNGETGWGADYKKTETIFSAEYLSFAAHGTVNTTDGHSVSFSLSFELSREYIYQNNIDIQLGNAIRKDPLVLNFDRPSAEIEGMGFTFDLDADGKAETLPFIKAGSGFLVLDKNMDGRVNDGSELFGPSTGNGFGELKALDSDNNDWIDENDKGYGNLQIWEKAGRKDKLSSLDEKSIGAIYLKSTATPFTHYNGSGRGLAEKASTGIFLTDSGSVSTIEQLNFLA